uniref:CABIT domain-containing protein n=1 Tax=Clytia hemisphaerica TaxID=252671 RepID=A0A7M5UZV8_9CNID
MDKSAICVDIQEATRKHGFPLNVLLYKKKMRNDNDYINQNNETHLNEMHCIQSIQDMQVYNIIDENGVQKNIPRDSILKAFYTPLKEDKFKTLSEVDVFLRDAKKKKRDHCRWVVCMRVESSSFGVLLRRGQVFRLISYKEGGSCCKKTTRKRAKVSFYGSKETFQIPGDLEGEFRLCEKPPSQAPRDDMTSITQRQIFPTLIQQNERSATFNCLLDIAVEKIIISCTEDRQIAVFPERSILLREILPDSEPFDSLSQHEIQVIMNKADTKYEYKDHYQGSFKAFGILRKPQFSLPSIPGNRLGVSISEEKIGSLSRPPKKESLKKSQSLHNRVLPEVPSPDYPSCPINTLSVSPIQSTTAPTSQKDENLIQDDTKGYTSSRTSSMDAGVSPDTPHKATSTGSGYEIPSDGASYTNVKSDRPIPKPRKRSNKTLKKTEGSPKTTKPIQDKIAQLTPELSRRSEKSSNSPPEKPPKPIKASPSINPKERKPTIPKRRPKYEKQTKVPKRNEYEPLSGEVSPRDSVFGKYDCTPILYDPYDTDPGEGDSDADETRRSEDEYSYDSFEDSADDYENGSRINIHKMTMNQQTLTPA